MNKIYFSLAVVSTLFLTACGETPEEAQANALCGCAEKTLAIQNELKDIKDEAKMKTAMDKFEKEFKSCEPVFDKLSKEMETMTAEQKKAKEEELLKSCDAFQTLKDNQEKAMKEQEAAYQKMQESLSENQESLKELEQELEAK